MQWRLYAPHRAGGASFMVFDAPAQTSRHVAAQHLRAIRKILYGRDASEIEATTVTAPAAQQPEPSVPITGQGHLF